jgi:hypothetical protein
LIFASAKPSLKVGLVVAVFEVVFEIAVDFDVAVAVAVAVAFDSHPLEPQPFVRHRKWIRNGRCLSAASFRPFPIFWDAQTGTPKGQGGGRLLFAYFFLAKQEKVSSCRATPGQRSQINTELQNHATPAFKHT